MRKLRLEGAESGHQPPVVPHPFVARVISGVYSGLAFEVVSVSYDAYNILHRNG